MGTGPSPARFVHLRKGKDNMGSSGIGLTLGCTKRVIRAAFAAAALLLPAAAGAQAVSPFSTSVNTTDTTSAYSTPAVLAPSASERPSTLLLSNIEPAAATKESVHPNYFDDAAPAAPVEQPNVHGFFSSPFKTAYVTPRGLV